MPTKNPQKTIKKPSAAPGNFEKPSKNPPAAPQNVKNTKKNHKQTFPGDIFEGFGQGKLTEGGACAGARAPLRLVPKAKTHKNVSGEGFLRFLGGRGRVF